MSDYDFLAKVLLIGDSGIGKSCMLSRFVDDDFSNSFISTIGVDFKIKTMDLEDGSASKRVKLHLWDTAGQERFRTITASYYRGSQAILMVFDVTDRDSFNHIESWLREVEAHTSTTKPIVMLAGNKTDLPDRVVSYEEAKNMATRLGIPYFETSAKAATGIQECFEKIAHEVISKKKIGHQPDSKQILLKSGGTKIQKSGCMVCAL